ncbi:MAG: LTA synthase family protein [Oscillospiraceae bacterium]|nr:LTA synthase family protein [Oscillospiraceae bacterium]
MKKQRELSPEEQPKIIARILWPILSFLSLFLLDLGFRYIYAFAGHTDLWDVTPLTFSVGWCLILTAVLMLLPRKPRRILMVFFCLLFCGLSATHGIFLNLFKRFFRIADFSFAGDGAAFADASYIVLSKRAIALIVGAIVLMALAYFCSRKCRGYRVSRVVIAAVLLAAGILGVAQMHKALLGDYDTVIWTRTEDTASDEGFADVTTDFTYVNFTDSKECLLKMGLYQYTFRDVWLNWGFRAYDEAQQRKNLDELFDSLPEPEPNDMTGVFEGKNLILIQLEAIDTYMLNEKAMPALYELQQNSLDFTDRYAPAYITAGTLNTEILANLALIPPVSQVSTEAYAVNAFPYSLAHLFEAEGYTAESFHCSDGSIYNRGGLHPNWGYERYNTGADMNMNVIHMDRYLINGFEDMTDDAPFCTFIITYSGHGAYSDENLIDQAFYDEMAELFPGEDDIYIRAMAHARETDLFIEELVDALTEAGLMDDTVLAFYSDHYNYYIMNDQLVMQYKGIDDINLLQITPFFIYSSELEGQKIDKPCSSVDILPTLANLFGLDTSGAWFAGIDLFSDQPGLVIFQDESWYDGTYYSNRDEVPADYAAAQKKLVHERFSISKEILLLDYYNDGE